MPRNARAGADHRPHLRLIRENLRDAGVNVLTYCQMSNHIYIVAVADREGLPCPPVRPRRWLRRPGRRHPDGPLYVFRPVLRRGIVPGRVGAALPATTEAARNHAESAVRHQFWSRMLQKPELLTSAAQAVPRVRGCGGAVRGVRVQLQ
jgi:hypothetical protein